VFHVERHRVGARLAATAPSGAPPYIEIPGRRLYILPTRRGAMFAALLFLMLVGSINYNNSLGHVFTFLLTGIACVAMLSIYRNLLGVEISAGDARPVFAGQRATIPLRLHNPLPLPKALHVVPAGPVPRLDIRRPRRHMSSVSRPNEKRVDAATSWCGLHPARTAQRRRRFRGTATLPARRSA
jgi:hypothetical protein